MWPKLAMNCVGVGALLVLWPIYGVGAYVVLIRELAACPYCRGLVLRGFGLGVVVALIRARRLIGVCWC